MTENTEQGQANRTESPLLSAILVVKNEERNIAKCLVSLTGLVDEVVVLDTGSTDQTVEIAKLCGAKVYHEPWRDNWAYTNNLALSYAKGEWALLVDADETLTDTDCSAVRQRLRDVKQDVLFVRMPIQFVDGTLREQHSLRVIRKSSGAKWVYPIHSQIVLPPPEKEEEASAKIDVSHSGITLHDHGYSISNDVNREKCRRNLRIVDRWEAELRAGHAFPDSPALSPDVERHIAHTILKSAWGIEDWGRCVEAAGDIIRLNEGSQHHALAVEEACILGAAALLNLKRYDAASKLIRRGQEYAPDNPDVHFVASAVALEWYASTIQGGGLQRPDLQLRVFVHDLDVALQAHQVLTSLVNAVPMEEAS